MTHRFILTSVLALALPGCAVKLAPEVALDAPVLKETKAEKPADPPQIVEVPKLLPLPGQLKPLPQHDETGGKTPGEVVGTANSFAKQEPRSANYLNAMQIQPYAHGALYRLYTALNQVSEIALEVGEKLISVSAGDTVRWVIGDTTSGQGATLRTHILVKPQAADLTTNLVITTDRRVYHLELLSTDKAYMASLSWTYPTSALTAIKTRIADETVLPGEPTLTPESLRFRYRIDGNAPWRPLQVFDDGRHVTSAFPKPCPRVRRRPCL